jgi:hypothetical protein
MPRRPATRRGGGGGVAHDPNAIPKSVVDAAADLLVGTAADTVGRLAKGTALDVLRVNAGATALEWAAASGGAADLAAPWIADYPIPLAVSQSNQSPEANKGHYQVFVLDRTQTINAVVYWNQGTTGNIDLGIFDDDDSGKPGTMLRSSGAVPIGAAGAHVQTLSSAISLAAGRYYVAFSQSAADAHQYTSWAGGTTYRTVFGALRYEKATQHPLATVSGAAEGSFPLEVYNVRACRTV